MVEYWNKVLPTSCRQDENYQYLCLTIKHLFLFKDINYQYINLFMVVNTHTHTHTPARAYTHSSMLYRCTCLHTSQHVVSYYFNLCSVPNSILSKNSNDGVLISELLYVGSKENFYIRGGPIFWVFFCYRIVCCPHSEVHHLLNSLRSTPELWIFF